MIVDSFEDGCHFSISKLDLKRLHEHHGVAMYAGLAINHSASRIDFPRARIRLNPSATISGHDICNETKLMFMTDLKKCEIHRRELRGSRISGILVKDAVDNSNKTTTPYIRNIC